MQLSCNAFQRMPVNIAGRCDTCIYGSPHQDGRTCRICSAHTVHSARSTVLNSRQRITVTTMDCPFTCSQHTVGGVEVLQLCRSPAISASDRMAQRALKAPASLACADAFITGSQPHSVLRIAKKRSHRFESAKTTTSCHPRQSPCFLSFCMTCSVCQGWCQFNHLIS